MPPESAERVGEWREKVLFRREAILSRGFQRSRGRSRGGFFSNARDVCIFGKAVGDVVIIIIIDASFRCRILWR